MIARRRALGGVAGVALLAALVGCHATSARIRGVGPLQLFGAAPELMPRLTFEPIDGTLLVSAVTPVFVTVVEVDPATMSRRVVFPEVGAAPLRLSGEVSLQLALCRDAVGAPAARGILVIASAETLVVAETPGARSWAVPAEMPEAWAAVYMWSGVSGSRAATGAR